MGRSPERHTYKPGPLGGFPFCAAGSVTGHFCKLRPTPVPRPRPCNDAPWALPVVPPAIPLLFCGPAPGGGSSALQDHVPGPRPGPALAPLGWEPLRGACHHSPVPSRPRASALHQASGPALPPARNTRVRRPVLQETPAEAAPDETQRHSGLS